MRVMRIKVSMIPLINNEYRVGEWTAVVRVSQVGV